MRIEELKKAKDQRPFRPFMIRMADGREVDVRHPDAVAWYEDAPRVAICATKDGWEVIEVGLVTSLAMTHGPQPAQAPEPNGGASDTP
ncbi:MAG: hypothetical protein ACLP7Q_01755 [Isosphaeraceae bacterium]